MATEGADGSLARSRKTLIKLTVEHPLAIERHDANPDNSLIMLL
jgi:hypothetical protein